MKKTICAYAGKVIEEGRFPCPVCKKSVSSYSILWQFCRCWLHKRCNGIIGKPKEDSEFKCQTCANRQIDIAEDCPGM